MTNYYQVDYKTGNIFQYSKDAKEGFEEHKTEKDGVTKISYRKYLRQGLIGIFKGIDIYDGNFGKEVQIKVIDQEGNFCKLTLPLLNQKGGIANFAASFAAYAPGLKVDYIYRIFPYAMEDTERPGKTNRGVSVKFMTNDWAGVNSDFEVERHKYEVKDRDGKVTQEGAIPAIEWEEGLGSDDVTANTKTRDKFLYGELKKLVTDFFQGGNGGSVAEVKGADAPAPAVAPQPKAEEPAQETPPAKEEPKTTVVVDQKAEAAKVDKKVSKKVETPEPVAAEPAGAMQANTDFDDDDESDLPF